MKKYSLNPLVFTRNKLFFWVLLVWSVFIYISILLFFIILNLNSSLINTLFLLLTSYVLSLFTVGIYGLYLSKKVFLTLSNNIIHYKNKINNQDITINTNDVRNINKKSLNLSFKEDWSLQDTKNVPGLTIWDVIKDYALYSAGLEFTPFSKKTLKKWLEARLKKCGVDTYERWYGRNWLELDTNMGKEIIPLDKFDSRTRNNIFEGIKNNLKIHRVI